MAWGWRGGTLSAEGHCAPWVTCPQDRGIRDEGSRLPGRACSQPSEHAGTAPQSHR